MQIDGQRRMVSQHTNSGAKRLSLKDVPANTTHHHLEMLMWRRLAAATYVRNSSRISPRLLNSYSKQQRLITVVKWSR